MNSKLKFLVFAIAVFSFDAYCCSPSRNMKYLTFAEAYAKADSAFVGTIEEVINAGKASQNQVGTDYKIRLVVEKSFKGTDAKKVEVHTNSNTCNPFGQIVSTNDRCLILMDSKGAVMSGLGYEEASFCVGSSTPRAKQMLSEYDRKIKKTTQ